MKISDTWILWQFRLNPYFKGGGQETVFKYVNGQFAYLDSFEIWHFHWQEKPQGRVFMQFEDELGPEDMFKLRKEISGLGFRIFCTEVMEGGRAKFYRVNLDFELPARVQFVRGTMERVFKPLVVDTLGLDPKDLPKPSVFQETYMKKRGFMPISLAESTARKVGIFG